MTARPSPPRSPALGDRTTARRLPTSWEVLILLLITLLAATLRLYRLTEVPPGLHFDEGFKGVTARALLAGEPPRLFFESDMGEEPVAMYLVAAALGLVGQEPWVVRLPSAIVGTLTVPLAWWLGRELFRYRRASRGSPFQEQVVGLGTALTLGILYWHLSFSRIGMEPILVPFFATLAFAALARGLNLGGSDRRSYPWFALAGGAMGGSLYTYKAGYFVPLVALLFVGYAAIVERGILRHHRRGLLLAALIALIVAAPIGIYFATHPANFLQRPASVALVGEQGAPESPWQAIAGNLPRVLGMFFLRGDANPRSNLPGRPALDPFLALLFLIGLVRCLIEFRRPAGSLPLIWLGVMVLPTLITGHAPHFGRAIGATPALAYLCALGGWSLVYGLGNSSLLKKIPNPKAILAALVAVGLVFAAASTARAYFQTWGQSPDLFYAYDVGLAQVAGFVNTLPASEDVYMTPTPRDHYTLQYLVQRPWAAFDGRAGLVFPPPDQAATVVVLVREDTVTLPALQRSRPDGQVVWTLGDGYDRPYAVAYHLPAASASAPQPEHPASATIGGVARLLGYSLDAQAVIPGEDLNLILYWEALAPLDEDYTVFTHLVGEFNPATNGPLWAGHDGQPDGGWYPTTVWQPGQVVVDVHPWFIPDDIPPGEYQLEAGLYLLATMARLPATDSGGNPLPGDAVPLGTIRFGD